MAKYTFLDLAEEVLKQAKTPLTYREIWNRGVELGLDKKLESKGKTPEQSLSARLGSSIEREDLGFVIVSKQPRTFWLASRANELDSKEVQKNIQNQVKNEEKIRKRDFNERDLHPLLVKFMRESEDFKLHCKTIYHELSKKAKSGKNQWIHPDIVGVHYPFGFQEETSELLKNLGKTPYELYSFELKVVLDFSNLRECYFRAVSNSSWANEGYLVVLECDESKEFMDELWRLSNAFGIGVIKLNTEDLLTSEVLIPANEKENLDFKTIDLLVDENPNFKEFIESINKNIELSNSKHKHNFDDRAYDEVFSDEKMEKHIKDKKII